MDVRFLRSWTQSKSIEVMFRAAPLVGCAHVVRLCAVHSSSCIHRLNGGDSGQFPSPVAPYAPYPISNPEQEDGPTAQLTELRRLIDRGNFTGNTMGTPKTETRDNKPENETEDKGRCSVHCPMSCARLNHL